MNIWATSLDQNANRMHALLFLAQTHPTIGSSAHYKTIAGVLAVIVFVVIGLPLLLARAKIIEWLNTSSIFRMSALVIGPVTAVLLSVLSDWEELFHQSTYETTDTSRPDWHTLFWVAIWAAGATITFAAALFTIAFKEGEELESSRLRVEAQSLERQRELLTDVTVFILRIVQKKRDRLLNLIGKTVTEKQLLAAMDPGQQIGLLVKLIYEFFWPDHPNEKFVLRLGIFARVEEDPDRLTAIHCWDGSNDTCFNEQISNQLELLNPHHSGSIIVRCFHSPDGCIIIENYRTYTARQTSIILLCLQARSMKWEVWSLISMCIGTQKTSPIPLS